MHRGKLPRGGPQRGGERYRHGGGLRRLSRHAGGRLQTAGGPSRVGKDMGKEGEGEIVPALTGSNPKQKTGLFWGVLHYSNDIIAFSVRLKQERGGGVHAMPAGDFLHSPCH